MYATTILDRLSRPKVTAAHIDLIVDDLAEQIDTIDQQLAVTCGPDHPTGLAARRANARLRLVLDKHATRLRALPHLALLLDDLDGDTVQDAADAWQAAADKAAEAINNGARRSIA